jgi:hypothetical protein
LTPTFASAASTLALSGIFFDPRRPSSAVTIQSLAQSSTRPAIASGEKPPKMTEWTAPMRAQASIAIAPSGTIGM